MALALFAVAPPGCQLISGLDVQFGRALGQPCVEANECISGLCVDGVCCAAACQAACERCDLEVGRGSCLPVSLGSDPDGECEQGLACDGAGQCLRDDVSWVQQLGGQQHPSVSSVAVDKSGNAKLGGSFSGTLTLSDSPGGALVQQGGPSSADDGFVLKIGPDGSLLEHLTFGAGGSDGVEAVAVTPDGKLALVGHNSSALSLAGTQVPDPSSKQASFLARLDDKLDGEWVRPYGAEATGLLSLSRVAVTGSDTYLAGGSLVGSATLCGKLEISTDADPDAVLVELGPDGTELACTRHGGSGPQYVLALATHPAGGAVIAIANPAGALELGGATYTSISTAQIVVARRSGAGVIEWARVIEADALADLELAVAPSGDVALAGSFEGHADCVDLPLDSAGTRDILVGALAAAGELRWCRAFGNSFVQQVAGLAVDGDGNLLVGGDLTGDLDFGGGVLTAPPGQTDGFVLKLSFAGAHVWSRRFGSGPTDGDSQSVLALAADEDANVLVAGRFFDRLVAGSWQLVASGGEGDVDGFLLKLPP